VSRALSSIIKILIVRGISTTKPIEQYGRIQKIFQKNLYLFSTIALAGEKTTKLKAF
jgi:hypothetical protein